MKISRWFIVGLVLLLPETVLAAPDAAQEEATQLSGMSIVGNDEAPKSLYIVPWKSSEIGVETSLDMKINKENVLVDQDVFKRQLDYYQVSQGERSGR